MRGTWQTTGGGGGGLGPLVGLGGLVVVGVLGYRYLEASLLGMRESARAANVALAWTAGAVGLVLVVGAVVWLLIGRRREVAQRPAVAEHEARMREARQRAIAHHPAGRALPSAERPVDLARVPSQRADRKAGRR